eukprot:SAG31_NODE_5180_length_2695_cov_2.182203_3_plen_231_part_01
MISAAEGGYRIQYAQSAYTWAKNVLGPEGQLSEKGKNWLQQIGRIIAVDVLINNSDRLPAVWDNDGNTENLMIAEADNVPIAIDTMVNCFDAVVGARSFEKLCSHVAALAQDLAVEPRRASKAVDRFRQLLLKGRGTIEDEAFCPPIGYDIGEAGVLAMMAGIQTGFEAAQAKCTQGWLDDACNHLRIACQNCALTDKDTTKCGDNGFAQISIDFLCKLIKLTQFESGPG